MLRSRPIVAFAVRFLLVYGLLMALWPVVCGAYREVFRTGGDALFRSFGSVRFRALAEIHGMNDTKIFVKAGESSQWTWMKISTRHVGYISTAAVVGLIVATPAPVAHFPGTEIHFQRTHAAALCRLQMQPVRT